MMKEAGTVKEIHAIQNEDGSYHVTITNKVKKKKLFGLRNEEETIEGTMEIPRALIEITALATDDEQRTMARMMV